ncbi:hypothetical protein [Christiangramia forsetii]|uniref:Uncharacterized protein n=2 Tax=Christiangramia forsetii TaxID=411153 RepID=A0M4P4_CHRFK|nr:hypothetical protein [Christiangramia forsetii]GGG22966.1 hypothetical protein GCM10011532_02580 [Christiangramia forsetii]CAL67589.1 hypothetical protein GFO_2633 [Christiangramia forsetii KT0803]
MSKKSYKSGFNLSAKKFEIELTSDGQYYSKIELEGKFPDNFDENKLDAKFTNQGEITIFFYKGKPPTTLGDLLKQSSGTKKFNVKVVVEDRQWEVRSQLNISLVWKHAEGEPLSPETVGGSILVGT